MTAPKAAHTPGPLALTKIASPIYGSNGSMVAEGVGIGAMNSVYVATVTGRKRDADAERLVACWNACEGMSDPAVEISALRSRSNGVPAMCAEVESLRAEVERLRAALQEVARIPADYDVCPQIAMRMYDAARAALGGGK